MKATRHDRLPHTFAWLFPEVALRVIDPVRDSRFILARVLESGTMAEVSWCIQRYGYRRIHQFFRDEGDSSISRKTITLWRLVLDARDEPWKTSRRSQLNNAAPWPG